MKTYIILIGIALILLFLIINSKVKISIKVIKDGKNDEVILNVRAFLGILRYKKEYPLIKIDKDKEGLGLKVNERASVQGNLNDVNTFKLSIEEIIINFQEYKKLFAYMMKKTKVEEIVSNLYFSSENVFLSIFMFNFINMVHKFIYDQSDAKDVHLKVNPGFTENALKIDFNTSCYLRLRNFIYLAKYYRLFKIPRGGA